MQMKRIVLASLLALSCLLPAQAKAADEIVVNGSTTVLPIMQKVSEAYMAANPNVQIALSGGGSGNGIKALLDGLANIAMSSRDIKGSEKELAAKKGINPIRTAVAVDALVPVVNPKTRSTNSASTSSRTSTPARSPIGRNWAAPTPTSWSCPATRPPAPTKRGKKWS